MKENNMRSRWTGKKKLLQENKKLYERVQELEEDYKECERDNDDLRQVIDNYQRELDRQKEEIIRVHGINKEQRKRMLSAKNVLDSVDLQSYWNRTQSGNDAGERATVVGKGV